MLRELTLVRRGAWKLALCALSLAALGAHAGEAWAAEPSVPECLAASEASLASSNAHERLAERTQLSTCASNSCPRVVRDECARRLQEVERLIPSVLFDVRDRENHPIAKVSISVDGKPLVEALDAKPIALDPGSHRFVIEAAGHVALTREVVLREGERGRAISVQLEPVPAPAEVKNAPEVPFESGASPARAQRVLAWATLGVGVVGLGVGSSFGAMAWAKKRHARDVCPDRCTDDAGVEAWDTARRSGNISTAAFAVGAAAAVASGVLWITLPAAPRLEVGLGNVSLRGNF